MATITLRSMTVKFGKPVIMIIIILINIIDAFFDIITLSRSIKSKDSKPLRRVQKLQRSQHESFVQLAKLEKRNLQQRFRNCENCMEDMVNKVTRTTGMAGIIDDISTLQRKIEQLEKQNALLLNQNTKVNRNESIAKRAITNYKYDNNTESSLTMNERSMSVEKEKFHRGFMILDDDFCGFDTEEETDYESILSMGGILTSTMIDAQSQTITQLLKDTIVHSDDEDITYKEFTKEFYYL